MTITPNVVMKGRHGTRTPITVRSHPSFHEQLVVEVTMPTTVVVLDEMLTGEIAIRSGNTAPFDSILLEMVSIAKIAMAHGERHQDVLCHIRIPASSLRDGGALPFEFTPSPRLRPTFRTSYIDHEVVLRVSAALSWHLVPPSFDIPLEVLPQGSILDGAGTTSAVGGDRLRRIARAMAQQTGLREGSRPPTLAYGDVGPVKVAILDAPKRGLGLSLDFTFPDLELGILFGPPGLLESISPSHESTLLPQPMAHYSLKCEPPDARPKIADLALAKLVQALLNKSVSPEQVRLSDHHLAFRVALFDDDEPQMIEIARFATQHAKVICDAISDLPFPRALAESRAAWQAIATEQNAFLIPTGPAIRGIELHAQVVGGETRTIRAALRTIWKTETPMLQAVLDFRENRLPEKAWADAKAKTRNEHSKSVSAIFPVIQLVDRGGGAVLDGATWPADPRSILPVLEQFLAWVIEARGERRAASPYR